MGERVGSGCLAPIFVGGTGRSGTTALAWLLDGHSNIKSIRWETQFIVARDGLLDLIDSGVVDDELQRFVENLTGRWYRRVMNPGTKNEYEAGLCNDISSSHLQECIEFLIGRVNELRSSPDPVAAAFVDLLLSEAVTRSGACRWCEKTPRNVLYIDRLWSMFPDMRFIHIIRDGRDVVASMVGRGFWPVAASRRFPSTGRFRGPVTFDRAVEYWVEILRLARESAASVPSENYLEVRLEDLVEDTVEVLQGICAFIDEDVQDAMLVYDLSRSHRGRWRDEFTSSEIERFHRRAGAALAREGYAVGAAL